MSRIALGLIFSFFVFQNCYAEQYKLWGDYTAGDWKWKVVIVPKDISQNQLLDIAKTLFKEYPATRVRFFSDDKLVKQFTERDRYLYDETGTVPEVEYPEEWVKVHHKANITDRSNQAWRRWQLVSVYGDHIAFLE